MDSEKSDAHFDLHHNCYARGQKNLAGEFFQNSQKLKTRKNGNILYHEIVSITLEDGVEVQYAKEALREIALKYIEDRCPRNMVYGCLHEDHADHLHYHLLISANERGEEKRFWHTTAEFDQIKRNLEEYVLQEYPKLKQRRIITADRDSKKQSKKAAEMKRQNKKLSVRDQVKQAILKAMMHCQSVDEFQAKLSAKGYEFYTRGKNYGVTVSHEDGKVKKYRFSTLGIHESYEEFVQVMESLAQAQAMTDDPETPKEEAAQKQTEASENIAGEEQGRESTPETDFSVIDDEPISENQDIEPPSFYQEMQDRRARQKQRKEQQSNKRNTRKPQR
jgi:hypothetical protein